MKIAQGAIGTGTGTLLYTVPSGKQDSITNIDVCNTTSGSLTFALHLVPAGVAVAAGNMLFPSISIAANTLVSWSGRQDLNAGDFIQGIGSATGITINITGDTSRA